MSEAPIEGKIVEEGQRIRGPHSYACYNGGHALCNGDAMDYESLTMVPCWCDCHVPDHDEHIHMALPSDNLWQSDSWD